MDCCLSYSNPRFPAPLAVSAARRRPIALGRRRQQPPRQIVLACASKCLNAPLEPRTPAGKLLGGVLLDDRGAFPAAARRELQRLAVEKDEAAARLQLSRGSDEACLHRTLRMA